MTHILLQEGSMKQFEDAISEHFKQGGSLLFALLTLAGIVAFVYVIYLITRGQERLKNPPAPNDPQTLFQQLCLKLKIESDHLYFLEQWLEEIHLENPSIILLSPGLYDIYLDEWKALKKSMNKSINQNVADSLKEYLFSPGQNYRMKYGQT